MRRCSPWHTSNPGRLTQTRCALSPAPLTLTRAPLQSPEKLQAALEEMGAAVERERAAAAEAERRLRASASRSEHVSKVLKPQL